MSTPSFTPPPPPPPPPPSAPSGDPTDPSAQWGPPPLRRLRRSRTDRVAAGVAGGLGEYLGLDPVLFRVLFAVSAFFGGAGILAYVLAWAAIPEQGTQHAAVDGWVSELRRRNVPFWAVAVLAGVVLWAVAFSWWAPGPFLPVLVVVVVLVVIFGRRADQRPPAAATTPETAPAPAPAPAPAVSLSKSAPVSTPPAGPDSPATPVPDWLAGTRAWIEESKHASRERRRRAFPVRIATLLTLVLTLVGIGIADAVTGVPLPIYFWCTGAIIAAGLLVGLGLRRAPWSMAPLLIPVIAGMIAFGNTSASLHDGIGDTGWAPSTAAELHGHYRLAFGRATLDLRALPPATTPRHVEVRAAAGQVRILLPATLNVTVHADVRIGEIEVNGTDVADTHGGSIYRTNGYHARQAVPPPTDATGAAITIEAHLADGQIDIVRGD